MATLAAAAAADILEKVDVTVDRGAGLAAGSAISSHDGAAHELPAASFPLPCAASPTIPDAPRKDVEVLR